MSEYAVGEVGEFWGLFGAAFCQVVDSKVSGNGLREGFWVGVNRVKLRQWLGGLGPHGFKIECLSA